MNEARVAARFPYDVGITVPRHGGVLRAAPE